MRSNIADVSRYQFRSIDQLLLDANIWLYIEGPAVESERLARIYSRSLKSMLEARSTILTNLTVLSEFINRFARIQHQLCVKSGLIEIDSGFKRFRKDALYRSIAADVVVHMRQIAKNAQFIDTGFSKFDLESLVDQFEAGDSDFNDLVIVELCRSQNLILVTHDADFGTAQVPLQTANPRLLRG